MLGHFVFIPYNGYVVGFSLYLYLRRLNPFPAFSSRNNVGDPSREDRETALMQCMHHLRAASGERSTLHVGLAATTPLFEEETYRKVYRMGRDALFLQVSSSLAPMQVCWRMLHCPAAKPRVATGQGREVFFPRYRCSVERTEGLMFFCLVISIYIYIAIALYCYILIYLYRYCIVYLLYFWAY